MKHAAILLTLLSATAPGLHAQSANVRVAATGQVTISGTSNVHDWKCSTTTMSSTITVPQAGPAQVGKEVVAIDVTIPVKSLDCGNGKMNDNLVNALHADVHPTIHFQMSSYDARAASAGYQASLRGSLTVNGATRPVNIALQVRPGAGGSVSADGSTSFSTRQYGVEPVKAMFGAIQTGEMVTILVRMRGTVPVTVASAPAPAPIAASPAPPARAPDAVVASVKPAVVAKSAVLPAPKPPAAKPAAGSTRVGAVAAATPPAPAPAAQAVMPVRVAVVTDTAAVTVAPPNTVIVRETVFVKDTAMAKASLAMQEPVGAPEATPVVPPVDTTISERNFTVATNRIQHMRARDQRGLFTFEPPKSDTVSYKGFVLQFGAAFVQELQSLHHSNTASPVVTNGVNKNELITIGGGFNNASANFYLDAQIARGIRVAVTSYLSSRHHNETWVKDGYFLIDASPIDNELLNILMAIATVKVGHFEINYGDAHFRRTDNGNAMGNPLVGNLILDAFTTEIGGEGYARLGPLFAMAGVTGGEIRGQVTNPGDRTPAWLGKLGFDEQLSPDLRVRLTASTYGTAKARSNTLYTGDRGGSPYFMVLENTQATESANAWSGTIRPGFANVVHAYMMNPFVKYKNAEFFGTLETATGKASTELNKRTMRQMAGEGVYRFGTSEQLYGAARYNRVNGQLPGVAADVSTDRWQVGGGWFVLPGVLAKAEYVIQRYHDFPATDIRNGGSFSGLMLAGAVAF